MLKRKTVVGTWRIVSLVDLTMSSEIYEVVSIRDASVVGIMKRPCRRDKKALAFFAREVNFVSGDLIVDFRPRCLDSGKDAEGIDYFVIEKGEPLPKRLSDAQVVETVDRIAEALALLHKERLLYCDVKRANVLMLRGKVMLTDFGTLTSFDEAESGSYLAGTLPYMAPEVMALGKVSEASDVYSLGRLLDELCTSWHAYYLLAAVVRRACSSYVLRRPAKMADFRRALKCSPWLFRTLVACERSLWIKVAALVLAALATTATCWYALAEREMAERREDLRQESRDTYCNEVNERKGIALFEGTANHARDPRRAFPYLKKAAEDPNCKNPRVFECLAECYDWGLGTACDLEMAKKFKAVARRLKAE